MLKTLLGICGASALSASAAFASTTTMLSSWYGSYFHGKTTANGERYNMHGYTGAHKTLPFGTKLRVCYKGCVEVRINDRGPYISGRELDLSYAAARDIGIVDSGVANVTVTYL